MKYGKIQIKAGILFIGFFFLCFYVWDRELALEEAVNLPEEPNGQETAQNDKQILLADITAQCEVWESRYGSALPVEIFKDLQRYVAVGECAEALSAYRQEELLCTVDELTECCPNYEMLADEYFETKHGGNLLERDKIYRLETADGKSCFLLFYLPSDATMEDKSFLSTMLLKKDGEEWQITDNSSGSVEGVDDYEIFERDEAGQKVYYLLKAYDTGDSFASLELAKLSESFYVPFDGFQIMLIETGVMNRILFQETGNALTVQIKEYVEENMWFLAWMQRNNQSIWGDENAQTHNEMREFIDSVGADHGIEQMWLIDFDGRTVNFQMAEAEDGSLILDAYAQEGNIDDIDGKLLVSCQICVIQEAGVCGCTPAYWEAFDFNGLTTRNTENIWLKDEVRKQAWKEQQQRSIASWTGEQIFSEELLKLLQEETWAGLYDRENVLLESYHLDLTEDTGIFMQRVTETDWENRNGRCAKDGECKWAYRWFEKDGNENFLTCINYGETKDSIQWWKMDKKGLEDFAYVTEIEEPSQLIRCEGQSYCITKASPEYRSGNVYTNIMEIGNSENWRRSYFSIVTRHVDVRNFTCISLYEEEGLFLGVKDYVQEWYEKIGEACMKAIIFSGTEEGKEPSAEERRIWNSLSDGSKDLYANHHYFAADVDNDGMIEYGYAEQGDDLDVTFYEKENGEFRIIPFDEVIPDPGGITGSSVETSALRQLWCETMGDTTYLFTVEELAYSPDYILRVRALKDD